MSTPEIFRKILAPYLMIGGVGGGLVLILLFLSVFALGYNPLFSEYLFWDVMLLSFAVFLASLNYHIKNTFKGYKILQSISMNALASILAIMIYTTFLGLALDYFDKSVEQYKEVSLNEVMSNREQFLERGLKDEDVDRYLEDIRAKEPRQIALDILQKLFLASPFIVFIAFVLILLMHFVMLVSRDRLIKSQE